MFVTHCWSFLAFLTIAGSSSSTSTPTTSLESSSLAKRNSSLKETFVQYNANCRWQRPLLLFCRQLVSCSHSVQCRSQHSARHKMNTILHNAPLHCIANAATRSGAKDTVLREHNLAQRVPLRGKAGLRKSFFAIVSKLTLLEVWTV